MTFRKIIGLILVLALMAGGGYYLLITERDEGDKMGELYAEVEPLAKERDDLIHEMDDMETNLALKTRDYATFEILFTELNSEIFYTAYPVMRDHDVVGVLALNYQEAPFYYGKLTVDEVLHLTSDGWGTCLLMDKSLGGFSSFWDGYKRMLETYKIPVPTSVYISDPELYDPSMDEAFLAAGITTIIFNGADGRTNTVTDLTTPLWTTYAMPWNYTGISNDFELLGRTDGGNQVYTLKFTEHWDKTKNVNKTEESQEFLAFQTVLDKWYKERWIYTEDLLADMDTVSPTPYIYLDTTDSEVLHELYLDEMTPEQQLLLPRSRSTTFEQALNYHRSAADNSTSLRAEMETRISEIERKVADLNAQIDAVYKKYNVAVTPTPSAEVN